VLVMVLFYYAWFSGFSGQSLYGANSWCYSGYNFFLGLPPFMLGFFDRDVKPRTAMTFQKLYYVGLKKADLNVARMIESFALAILDAVVIFFMTLGSFKESTWHTTGSVAGINVFGNTVFGMMIFAMLAKICLLFSSWNSWSIFSVFFSVAFYLVFIFVYSAIGPYSWDVGEYDFYLVPQHMFGVAGFWLCLALVPTTSFVIAFVLKALRNEFATTRDVVAAEYEYNTRHLSPEARGAMVAAAEARFGGPGSGGSAGGGGAGAGNVSGRSGGGSLSGTPGGASPPEANDDEAPRVKVGPSVLQSLHRSMSTVEREFVGHMSNRKLRSSFVDNAPAEQSYFAAARGGLNRPVSTEEMNMSRSGRFGAPVGPGHEGEQQLRRSVSSRGSFTGLRGSASAGGALRAVANTALPPMSEAPSTLERPTEVTQASVQGSVGDI